MKKGVLAAALAVCVLLSGCAALLERSYSVVEPYADRYWDSGAEDTLKVDNYQDLVNSLLMLIEQQAEEAVIRCYDEVSSYQAVARARSEVRWETMLGSYLLKSVQFSVEDGPNYSTASFHIVYREDVEDLSSIMTLSDSQSLVDLLRLAVREEHEKITAQFTFDTPRESVSAAVESCWQELCREEMEDELLAAGSGEELPEGPPDESNEPPSELPEGESAPEEPDGLPEGDPVPGETGPDAGETEGAEPVSGTPEEVEPEPDPIVYPPCPWVVRFYPNQETAELVEILLRKP